MRKPEVLCLVFILFVGGAHLLGSQPPDETDGFKKFQLGLDVGAVAYPKLSGALSLSFRTSEKYSWGLRLGFVWEDDLHSYADIELWNVFHADFFRRYEPSSYFFLDIGGSLLAHSPEDDTDDAAYFVGTYTSVSLGYKFIFLSPVIRLGYSSEEGFGVVFSPLILKLRLRF